jgi:hypothetical protein
MINRHSFGVTVLLGALVLALGGCGSSGGADTNSAEVRYKVTVEVDTPQGVRSGSSVWSWRLSRPTLALASAYDGKFSGEAVAVDLPNGKTLFALVSGQELIPERQFPELPTQPRETEDRVADIREIASSIGAKKQIPCEKRTGDERGSERMDFRFDCLMLVSFADVAQPTSVFAVDYHDPVASLGKGYAIKGIMVEITDAPVTVGLREKLSWLGEYPEPALDPKHGPKDFSLKAILKHGHFSIGVSK